MSTVFFAHYSYICDGYVLVLFSGYSVFCFELNAFPDFLSGLAIPVFLLLLYLTAQYLFHKLYFSTKIAWFIGHILMWLCLPLYALTENILSSTLLSSVCSEWKHSRILPYYRLYVLIDNVFQLPTFLSSVPLLCTILFTSWIFVATLCSSSDSVVQLCSPLILYFYF